MFGKKIRKVIASNNWSTSRNMNIVIILFGVLFICSNLLGLFYKIQMERQLEVESAFKDTGRFARAFEEHTVRTIKEADQLLLSLKYQYEQEGLAFDIAQYAKTERMIGQPFVQLSIIDEKGELVASNLVPFVSANLKDREHFLVHKDSDSGQLFVGKTVMGRASDQWSIQMSRRINKPDGSFGGVAVVSVSPFYFSEFYKRVDLGESSSIALIGRDGFVRVRQDGQEVNAGQDFSESIVLKALSVSNTGQFSSKSRADGIKRIYSYRALSDYPLVVVVGVAEEEVFRGLVERVIGYYWLAGVITLVIIFFIIILLFITEKQKHNAQALKQARDGLEVKVEERTQELFAANKELTAMNEEQTAMNEELTAMNEEQTSINEELQCANQSLKNEIAERNRVESILKTAEEKLVLKTSKLAIALQDIGLVQARLIQQEKMAGIGQLAAGVAHEINNPLGFVMSNVEALEQYFNTFNVIVAQYRELGSQLAGAEDPQIIVKVDEIYQLEKEQDLNYILADIPDLLHDTNEGLNRMSKIVKGMRLFSRVDQQQVFELYDMNKGLENTILVAHNEIKYNATLIQNFGCIPEVEVMVGEINQVLLNLIVNAAQAIKEKNSEQLGVITLSTWHDKGFVYCAMEDDGAGIVEENIKNIFNPFFTTKPVGQGTGMGLSISYEIVVNRHHGAIMVESILGKGTKFVVKLPIKHDILKTIKNSGI